MRSKVFFDQCRLSGARGDKCHVAIRFAGNRNVSERLEIGLNRSSLRRANMGFIAPNLWSVFRRGIACHALASSMIGTRISRVSDFALAPIKFRIDSRQSALIGSDQALAAPTQAISSVPFGFVQPGIRPLQLLFVIFHVPIIGQTDADREV
jgi:hypothetical protein